QRLVARQGVTMTRMMAPTPICVPSRASMLTGRYAHNHGMLTVGGPAGTAAGFTERGLHDSTIATWLDDAGYDTFMVGKWMNGLQRKESLQIPVGWDRWVPAARAIHHYWATKFLQNGRLVTSTRYNTYEITKRTVRWIKQHRRVGAPWFAWVNYVGPHHGRPREYDDPPGIRTAARPWRD